MKALLLSVLFGSLLIASGSYPVQSGTGTSSIWSKVFGGSKAFSNYSWTTSSTPAPPPFSHANSVSCDGSAGYLAVPGTIGQSWTQAQSYLMWVKITAAQGKDLYGSDWTTKGVEFYYDSGFLYEYFFSNPTAVVTRIGSQSGLIGSGFHHLVVTYDGSKDTSGVALYIDGAAQSLSSFQNNINQDFNSGNTFGICGQGNGTNLSTAEFNGFAVYSSVLSASDVTAAYNGGTPVDLSTLSSYSNIRAWYEMGNCSGDTTSTIKNCANPGTFDATGHSVTIVADSP